MYKVPHADGGVNVQDLLELLSNADLQEGATAKLHYHALPSQSLNTRAGACNRTGVLVHQPQHAHAGAGV